MNSLTVFVHWRTAMASEEQPYYFPDRFAAHFKDKYAISGVYRWRVLRNPGEAKEMVYIGEAEDLIRRMQRVLTPSRKAKEGDTNRRLNEIFNRELAAGRKIVLDVADIEPFEINGVPFASGSMGDRFKRRALENLLLALAQASGQYDLLNVSVDPVEKARQAIARLPPHVIRDLIRKHGPDRTEPSAGS